MNPLAPRSLGGRLSAALALSLVILLGLQWIVASLAIAQLMERQLTARLARDAESLLAALQEAPGGGLQLDPRRVSPRYQRPFSGYYYTVVSGGQRETSRSLWDADIAFPLPGAGRNATLRAIGPERQPLLVYAAGFRKHNLEVTVALGEDLTSLNAGLRRFQLIHGGVSVAILLALLLVQRRIVRAGLQPLDAVRQDMERLAAGVATRIESPGPAEIAPLIAQLNRLLETMGRRSRRSREALGNLAHALKTRLALLNQVATQPQMREALADMDRIVERELKRARLAGEAQPGQRVDLDDELTLLAQTLRVLHADKAPDIDWSVAPGLRLAGDREDLLELLGNLLDNACKWSRGRVVFRASGTASGDGILLTVEDDGPGCAPATLETLARRGFRADETTPGSGLGLAIVRDIVESYGGRLAFGRAALGGLRVEIELPGDPSNATKGEST
ncbi:MAG TPA: sensor histidine kinase [Burkholderiales bacterium]|jgi:signal transduction histidine kinase|nr:sensor histidine kinase [Burkholderiales bacterium]